MMRKPKMDKLSRGFQRFHAYLQTLKVDQRVTWKQLLVATGWKESTLQTYLRKNKLAGFLAELPNASFQVLRNGDSITEADIAGALSQVTPEVMSLYKGEKLKGESSLYVLEKKLGEGAVGHVWAARAEKSNGAVAIKIVNPRPDLLERSMVKNIQTRFRREAKHGRNLSSDCIVQMLDHGEHRAQPFLVMELARQSAASHLRARGPYQMDQAHAIVRRCAEGLAYLHGEKCVHRDVKPANILDFDRGYVLGDLGIVKWSDLNPAFTSAATITRASIQLGSWFYMAPEQQSDPHEAVPASDVYALGVTWYELLTGSTASPASFAAQKFPPPCTDKAVNALIGEMTRYDPADRPSLDRIREFLAN